MWFKSRILIRTFQNWIEKRGKAKWKWERLRVFIGVREHDASKGDYTVAGGVSWGSIRMGGGQDA